MGLGDWGTGGPRKGTLATFGKDSLAPLLHHKPAALLRAQVDCVI